MDADEGRPTPTIAGGPNEEPATASCMWRSRAPQFTVPLVRKGKLMADIVASLGFAVDSKPLDEIKQSNRN